MLISLLDDDITAHGVLQELWYNIPSASITSLLADRRFPNSPDVVNFLESFDAPADFQTNYGQRLTAYLQVFQYVVLYSLYYTLGLKEALRYMKKQTSLEYVNIFYTSVSAAFKAAY